MKSSQFKQILLSLFVFVIFWVNTISVFASIPIPNLQSTIYVCDDANIIDENTEDQINTILTDLNTKTGVHVLVVTVPSLNGYSIEDYANELFNTIGIGDKDRNDGVLLLISSGDTRVRLEIGVGLEGILTDSVCGRILDADFVPYRAQKDYNSAVLNTITSVSEKIANYYDFKAEPVSYLLALIFVLLIKYNKIIFVFICFLWLAHRIMKFDSEHECGGGGGSSSYYGSGSSGYSNYSSSSSSGGFSGGGGRSGGGGASR